MLQTLNCIRMGEVLLDENLQLFILCSNCHTDLRNLQDFRQHLEKCEGLENLFHQGRQQFKYNSDKCTQLFGKTAKGIKEYLIYDYNDVEVAYTKAEENFIDLINIEEELLDPKWYSDLSVEVNNTSPQKTSKQYEELVEAVTPFVQFKENLKSNNNASNTSKSNYVKSSTESKFYTKKVEKVVKNVKFDMTVSKTRPTAKRKLSMQKPAPIHFAMPTVCTEINTSANNSLPKTAPQENLHNKKRKSQLISNGFIKPTVVNSITAVSPPTATKMLPPTTIPTNIILNSVTRKTSTIPTTIVKHEPTKEKQTAQILNKLQNLGLQVKRTQPHPAPISANISAPNKTDTKTLEILQRLQSKGMKVKILNKQQTMETNVNIPSAKQQYGIITNCVQKPINVVRTLEPNFGIRQNLNKNLIIKKVN